MLAVLSLYAADARAVGRCKVSVKAQTGAIEVSASNVGTNPHWGSSPSNVHAAFYDGATCFNSSSHSLSKCHLGAPGTLAAATPPEGCAVYISDDSGVQCNALLKGCTPGMRPRDASFTDPNDPRGIGFANASFILTKALNFVGDFEPSQLTGLSLVGLELAGTNLSGFTLSGVILTGADLTGANLSSAFLEGTNLASANLTNADLTNADLNDATLTNVVWSNTVCPDGANSGTGAGATCCGHLNGSTGVTGC